ncbi:MAG: hypothetical protein AAFR51_16535 [Pseudomonadota bacterium]
MTAVAIDFSRLGKYLFLADAERNLISVLDDVKYDRADADILSVGMRLHAIEQLKKLGFKQISGRVLEHQVSGARCLIPKFHALGASPFDCVRYTPKREQDYYLLTPTQTACQFIDAYPMEPALERIKALIERHPINILRIMDFCDHSPAHRTFVEAVGHLKFVQREAVESDFLRGIKSLG